MKENNNQSKTLGYLEAALGTPVEEKQPEKKTDQQSGGPVRYVNIPLPLDLHRRLNAIKYDHPGEKLSTLGLQAIEEFVVRMEAKKKNGGV